MEGILSQTKAEFIRTKEQMAHALATTPDDKLAWSPSPTARSPLHQVTHAAMSTSNIQSMLSGKHLASSGPVELDAAARLADQQFTSRQQAIDILEQNSADYLAWLDTLTEEQLASKVDMFFGIVPMTVGITFPALHMSGHVAQMDYIQTIYGDQDWHIPAQKPE
jgi:replication fork clamp-binding protein CrfC